jgi:hypothetical protein
VTIAPAPLAYSSNSTTIAVSSATAQAQAQRQPRGTRPFERRFESFHKKPQSTLAKWWSSVENALDIK